MKRSTETEFAHFRFVRDVDDKVVDLSSRGAAERTVLVIDTERWGLANLHIFEGAARREEVLQAFQEEMPKLASIRSEFIAHLVSWGRDEEELFYADTMPDGENLPDYLGRAGKVPVPVAAEWTLQLMELLESVGTAAIPSFERFTTQSIRVGIDHRQRVRAVFAGFHGWTKPETQVREHDRNWYLAQIFCSLMGGIPVRTFSGQSLPRNFGDLGKNTRREILRTLNEEDEEDEEDGEALSAALQDLAAKACEQYDQVPLPRMPVREWLRRDLARCFEGEPEFILPEKWERDSERYAVSTRIRGRMTWIQVLPGVESIPRQGWLNQHHDATRRPGRALLHQLQVNFLADSGSVTLVGEEQADGVDLASLILETGPCDAALAAVISGRVGKSLRSLESGVGARAVWWLPPENVYFLTGSGLTGSLRLLERKGDSAWHEWAIKMRLHQTTGTLCDGVSLPIRVRELCRESGRQSEAVRRAAVALPLLFFLLAAERFRWRQGVAEQADFPDDLAMWFESHRIRLSENPSEFAGDLFAEFAQFVEGVSPNPSPASEQELPQSTPKNQGDGYDTILETAVFAGEVDLSAATVSASDRLDIDSPPPDIDPDGTEPSTVVDEATPGTELGAPGSAPDAEPGSLPDAESRRPNRRKSRLVPISLAALVLAVTCGYFLSGWNREQGPLQRGAEWRLPLVRYESPPPPSTEQVISAIREYAVDRGKPEMLVPLQEPGTAGNRTAVKEWLRSELSDASGDAPAAARWLALLAWVEGEPAASVLEQLESASRLGDAASQFWYAVRVLVEGDRAPDPSEADAFLKASATSGNPHASEWLAIRLYEAGDHGEARALMESAARLGQPGALYHIGLFEAEGVGKAPDPAGAVARFREAAELGDPRAMFAYGLSLESGFGVARSFTEATRWMKKAALLGNDSARRWCESRGVELPPRSEQSPVRASVAPGGDS